MTEKKRIGTHLRHISDDELNTAIGGALTRGQPQFGSEAPSPDAPDQAALHDAAGSVVAEAPAAVVNATAPEVRVSPESNEGGPAHETVITSSHSGESGVPDEKAADDSNDTPFTVFTPSYAGGKGGQSYIDMDNARGGGKTSAPDAHDGESGHLTSGHPSFGASGTGAINNAYNLLDQQVSPISGGDKTGHVNADLPGGERSGGHTAVQTTSNTVTIINAHGLTERATESTSVGAGETYRAGPAALEANATADVHSSGEVHVGPGGIDIKGQAGVNASASVGASVSGSLGHGVSGTVGVEDVAEVHANVGARLGTQGVEAAAAAGATNATNVGAGIKADVGHDVSVDSEVHAGVVEVATVAAHAGIGADGIGMGTGGTVGAYESAGASFSAGTPQFGVEAAGDIHGPGAIGFSEDASANFHDGKVTFNLNGSVDLGLVGFDFHLGSTVDVSGIEKSAEKTLDGAATHLDGYCKVVASGVTHVAKEADNQITHVADTFGNDAVNAAQDVKNVAATVDNTVVHFGEKVIDEAQQEAQYAAEVAERTAQSVATHVANAAETIGNDIKNVAETVGKDIKNAAETAVNKVAGFFKGL